VSHPTEARLREIILRTAQAQRPKVPGGQNLQAKSILRAVAEELGIRQDPAIEEAILTQWHDLFRTGYFAWGHNLMNPDPPFFHIADRGRRTLEQLSRDPGNPAGYRRHLYELSKLNPIAGSYLDEGLNCFVSGLYKAAAVMIGGAAESIILELRDLTSQKLAAAKQREPKGFSDWRVKTVLDALHGFLSARKSVFPRQLREEFEAYWMAFAQQIRSTRNDAGHPSSVDLVTEQGVHASFLIFPELARLSSHLSSWIDANVK
jgi:hypothetical protein